MTRRDIYIVGRGMVTPAGETAQTTWQGLRAGVPHCAWDERFGPVGRLAASGEAALAELRRVRRWRAFDRAALLGIIAAREAWTDAGGEGAAEAAVVMGSSRGATETLEREHDAFLGGKRVAPTASPMSTFGTFSTAVSQALGTGGPAFAVSSACSTGLTAIGAALAMIASGQTSSALAGGAEASLTPFTLAQLEATSVLARRPSALYPCRPMHPEANGLVPGEGAGCVVLSCAPRRDPAARVLGFGAATEPATATGISRDGRALVVAVERALGQAAVGSGAIDLVVGHGAGTAKGDRAELAAYRQVFPGGLPPMTFHKWLTGHMLGAAAAVSVGLACQHLAEGEVPGLPYFEDGMEVGDGAARSLPVRHVLVTALGFGGNAAALVLGRP